MKGVVPNFSVNHIPYWDPVTKGKEYPTFIGGAANWILNGHTEEEYKGLAKFIEFMGSPEMDLYYHNMTGYSAVTKGAWSGHRRRGTAIQIVLGESLFCNTRFALPQARGILCRVV